MSVTWQFVFYKFALAIVIVALVGTTTFAQEETVAPVPEDEVAPLVESEEIVELEEIEEIIVVAPKPGGRRRVDREYEDPVRAKLLMDFYKMQQDQEEFEWRKAGATESTARIKWGYDPRDDYRMRREMDLQDLSWERSKPATLFRIEL